MWLMATLIVAVVAAFLIWYLLKPAAVEETTAPAATDSSTDTELNNAAEELKAVDINELKAAVDELKTTLAAFQ
jgi:hypothetical protein